MKACDNMIIFETSGREIDVNCCIIGIDPSLKISGGYDQGIYEKLDLDERRELAKYMIDLWEKYKICKE